MPGEGLSPETPKKERNITVRRKAAAWAGALGMALAAKYGLQSQATYEYSQGHPDTVTSAGISAEQQAAIDQAAHDNAMRLLHPHTPDITIRSLGVSDVRTTIDDGQLIVQGKERRRTTLHAHKMGDRVSIIRFQGAPTSTSPAAIDSFLAHKPHVASVGVRYDGAIDGYNLSMDVTDNDQTGVAVTVIAPEQEGYVYNKPDTLTFFYNKTPAEQAAVIAGGLPDGG